MKPNNNLHDVFFKSDYWKHWARLILLPEDEFMDRGNSVRIYLTAINNWEQIASIWIVRDHWRPEGIVTKILPSATLSLMKENLGEVTTSWLLEEENPLEGIDWAEYFRVCNGGASFRALKG